MLSGRLRLTIAAILAVCTTTAPASAQASTSPSYALDTHSSAVGFTIVGSSFFKIRRDGQFKQFTGQVSYDPANPAGTAVELTVYTSSVDMDDSDNESLLKSADFFDVAHYPTMHFASESVELKDDGTFALTGDMTIRGITKRMTIPVRLRRPDDASAAVFETNFQIDRTEFGLNGTPSWAGFKVSINKNVEIHITMATTPQNPPTH
jgi:polyisoprenoid-binding protein YceI